MEHRRIGLAGIIAAGMLVVLAAAHGSAPAQAGRGPLASALGLETGPVLDRRRAAAVAVITAACMRAAGHPYEPWIEPLPVVPDDDLGPIAWAERWGFGISTAAEPVPPPPIDPNLRRLALRPQAERAPVVADLYGVGDRAGCQPHAIDTVYGLRERLLAPLRPGLTTLAASIDADPAMVAARDAWVACVADVVPGPVRAPARLGDLDALRDWFARRIATADDAADRRVIQADERRVAAAVARCDLTVTQTRQRVAAPYEAAFIDHHRAPLDRYAAAIRRAEAAYPSGGP